MKHFTMIELIAVMAITAFLVSVALSIGNINNRVELTQIEIGSLIEKAKLANTMTQKDSVISYDGKTFSIQYHEYVNGTLTQVTASHDVKNVTVQMFQGGKALAGFTFRDFEIVPGGAEVRVEISTPKDKGVIIRVNTFTGRLSYYESAKQ